MNKTAGDRFLLENQLDSAIQEYRQAIQIHASAACYFNLAIAYFQGGRPQEAATCLERAVEMTPDDAEALYDLACLRLREGQFDAAESFFQKAAHLPEPIFKTRSAQALEWIRELKTASPEDRIAVLSLLQRLSAVLPGF